MSRVILSIAVVVLLAAFHLVGAASTLDNPDALRAWHDVTGWIGSFVGVIGCGIAMSAFARGDHLRRVWALLTASSALLLVGTALRSYFTHAAPGVEFIESSLLYPRAFVVIAANAVAVWALVLLVTEYRKTGLSPPWTPASIALWVVVSAVALFLAVRQFDVDVGRFHGTAGIFSALTSMASTLGDTVTIILIVPILRVAYLLRGGRLAWVWWALGLSGAAWLVYDGREWIAHAMPGSDTHNLELLKVLRTPGLALVGLAGFLQKEALREEPQQQSSGLPAAGG